MGEDRQDFPYDTVSRRWKADPPPGDPRVEYAFLTMCALGLGVAVFMVIMALTGLGLPPGH